MKRFILLPGIVVVLVVLVAACAPPPNLRDDAMLRDDSLITNTPCTAPCWNGITPGETLWSDALTKLEDDPALDDPTTRNDDQSSAIVAEFQRTGGSSCCQMVTLDGEKVNLVFLRFAPNMTVGQVIDAHGEPAYLVGSPFSDDQAIINLIYPDLSTVIYVFVAGATNGVLSADSEVIGALYTTPADMDTLLKTSNLNVWEGYNTYAYYDQGPFEVTPSETLTPTPSQ